MHWFLWRLDFLMYIFSIALVIFSLFIISNSQTTGPCSCDLTRDVCDLNCCCDSKCTQSDINTFTYCSDRLINSNLYNKRLCLPNSLIFQSNSPYIITALGDLVCIDIDNYNASNYYQAPPVLTSDYVNSLVNQLIPQNTNQVTSGLTFQAASSYKQGNPLWTFYDRNYVGYLALPNQNAGLCEKNAPLTYLNPKSESCFISELTSCTQSQFLDYVTFNPTDHQLLINPNSLQLCSQEFSVLSLTNCSKYLVPLNVSCINSTGQIISCASPAISSTNCDNIAKSVKYTIKYENPTGVTSASVIIQLESVAIGTKNYQQTFSATFEPSNSISSSPYKYSGNPGYLFNEPVLAGRNDSNTIIVNSDRSQWLTIPKPSASGECNQNSRSSVTFGVNIATDCVVEVNINSLNCVQLQSQINSIINNGATIDFIGKFGNSNPSSTSEWLKIQKLQNAGNNPSSSGLSSCNDMVLGANIIIAYSNIGNVSNPQSIINYVEYSWFNPEEIRYQCFDQSCSSGLWKLRITTKVTYLNVSVPPVSVESQIQKPQAKLPQDFFYPFVLNTNNSSKMTYSLLLTFIFLVFLLY